MIVVPVRSPGSIAPDLLELAVGHADGERLPPLVAAVADLGDQAGRQGVDDRDADAVQTAGDLVAAAAELAAGVEQGQRHRQRGQLLAGGGVGGDAASVVLDPDAAVGLEGEHDPVAVAGQRLVDRVVDDLPDQVVQAALAGRADVHARPLADRLETLEDLDRRRVVVAVVGVDRGGGAGLFRSGTRLGHTHLFIAVSMLATQKSVAAPGRTTDLHDSAQRARRTRCRPQERGASAGEICP